ncbi:MAG: HPr family phosphocarrier protein [Porticoccaceae bacterium]|nr:HPr family phosphocarrier protein [Porticoccaceae bacterium]MDG1310818.1 HPr family phosphocarrier protein [Porticoccaceae bacterium]
MIRCQLPVINKLGLHARAATKLASAAAHHQCIVRTGKEEPLVDAKSIMSLMLLAANQGTQLIFEFDGPDEQVACDEITALLNDYFGEGE